jgi:long-chain fatty acid transport protein
MAAHGAALDRSGQSITTLFQQGNYAEVSLTHVQPELSGVEATASGRQTGNIVRDYRTISGAIKFDLDPQISFAVILDHPCGANVQYNRGTIFQSTTDDNVTTVRADAEALTGLIRYKLTDSFSLHTGIKGQQIDAAVALRGAAFGGLDGYDVKFSRDVGFGFLVGGTIEAPEIGFRLALTYGTKIEHRLPTTESFGFGTVKRNPDPTIVHTPQYANLDFQIGLAPGTLLFGSLRAVAWDGFDITPPALFAASKSALVSYSNDDLTYSLGIGRRFSSSWFGAVEGGYEIRNGGFVSILGPTDGF